MTSDKDRARVAGDREIRATLLAALHESHASSDDFAVVEELGLCRGEVRVDVTLVNGAIHGYEIKSDRDTLRRLARQGTFYSSVLDRVTLVVGERHVDDALALVPSWWEVLVARTTPDGVTLWPWREGGINASRDARAIAELLWRDEALAMLASRDAARGFRSSSRREIWDRICELYDIDEIAAAVRERLKSRSARRSVRLLA